LIFEIQKILVKNETDVLIAKGLQYIRSNNTVNGNWTTNSNKSPGSEADTNFLLDIFNYILSLF
jgi:hypothetical protein